MIVTSLTPAVVEDSRISANVHSFPRRLHHFPRAHDIYSDYRVRRLLFPVAPHTTFMSANVSRCSYFIVRNRNVSVPGP